MDVNAVGLLSLTVKIVLSIIFATVSLSKILSQTHFRNIVTGYALLPASLVAATAVTIPILEIIAATFTLIPHLSHIGLAAIGGLLVLYSAALGSVYVRQVELKDCGCGLVASPTHRSLWPIARNGVLVVLVIFSLATHGQVSDLAILEWIVVGSLSAFVFMMYSSVDGLWANRNKLALAR